MEINQSADTLEINYKPTYQLATINWFGIIGVVALVLSIVLKIFMAAVMGLLFLGAYWIARSGFSVRQTVLHNDGLCEITTKRIFGDGIFKQTFPKSDITKITYLKGYSDQVKYYRAISGIYIHLKSGEKLEVLSRPAFKPLAFKSNKPLDQEADVISRFLNIPLDTVDISTAKSSIQNFNKTLEMGPHDPSMVILQPKTSEKNQTDAEGDNN